ncbi:MAG TPA: hypothetical protein VMT91_15390 [Anaerolineales bacterium]|nr:hypothetical protein [Anaerolineales bacterium]
MTLELHWLNCFWLILPVLAWNLLLGARITDPRITSDAHSPQGLLAAENLTRLLVFALPVLMPLPGRRDWLSGMSLAGLIVYISGTLVYFSSWLPFLAHPPAAWSNHAIALLAPRLTPYLSFLGISLLGGAWFYGIIAALFIFFHTWHGIQNLN